MHTFYISPPWSPLFLKMKFKNYKEAWKFVYKAYPEYSRYTLKKRMSVQRM